MWLRSSATVVVMACLAAGQAQNNSDGASAANNSEPTPLNAVVLRIKGVCHAAETNRADCETKVTREEFERIAHAANPSMPREERRHLGQDYAHLLAMAQAAQKLDVEKDPAYQAALHLATLRLLEEALTRKLQREAEQVTSEQVEAAYKREQLRYMQADLLRVFIPEAPAADHEDEIGTSDIPMKDVAEEIRTRAAAGANFNKLQTQAFVRAGIKGTPPETALSSVTPEAIPGHAEVVFSLKPGDVSPVLKNAAGFFVYKLVSKQVRPLEAVRTQIAKELASKQLEKLLKAVDGSVRAEFDPDYFPPASPAMQKGNAEFYKILKQQGQPQQQ